MVESLMRLATERVSQATAAKPTPSETARSGSGLVLNVLLLTARKSALAVIVVSARVVAIEHISHSLFDLRHVGVFDRVNFDDLATRAAGVQAFDHRFDLRHEIMRCRHDER